MTGFEPQISPTAPQPLPQMVKQRLFTTQKFSTHVVKKDFSANFKEKTSFEAIDRLAIISLAWLVSNRSKDNLKGAVS